MHALSKTLFFFPKKRADGGIGEVRLAFGLSHQAFIEVLELAVWLVSSGIDCEVQRNGTARAIGPVRRIPMHSVPAKKSGIARLHRSGNDLKRIGGPAIGEL